MCYKKYCDFVDVLSCVSNFGNGLGLNEVFACHGDESGGKINWWQLAAWDERNEKSWENDAFGVGPVGWRGECGSWHGVFESDLQFDFEANGGELPTGVANPLIADGCHKGEGKMPGAEVKDGDAVPTLGTAYTVRYEGNTNAGTAKAILTGLPPYVGSVANVFLIAKRSVTLTSGTAR